MIFLRTDPSSVDFPKLIKTNKLQYEEVKVTDDISYYEVYEIFESDGFDRFQNFVQTNPIWRMNNEPDLPDMNPFSTIHLPTWATKELFSMISELYVKTAKHIPSYRTDNFITNNDWGNIYFKEECRPIRKWRLPHIDYVSGLAGNMWFTDHTPGSSGTVLWKYVGGETQNGVFEYQGNPEHPRYAEWHAMDPLGRDTHWTNFTEEEGRYWGFESIGFVPSKYRCMTCYPTNVPHTPYIDNKIDLRWSHTFCAFE